MHTLAGFFLLLPSSCPWFLLVSFRFRLIFYLVLADTYPRGWTDGPLHYSAIPIQTLEEGAFRCKLPPPSLHPLIIPPTLHPSIPLCLHLSILPSLYPSISLCFHPPLPLPYASIPQTLPHSHPSRHAQDPTLYACRVQLLVPKAAAYVWIS